MKKDFADVICALINARTHLFGMLALAQSPEEVFEINRSIHDIGSLIAGLSAQRLLLRVVVPATTRLLWRAVTLEIVALPYTFRLLLREAAPLTQRLLVIVTALLKSVLPLTFRVLLREVVAPATTRLLWRVVTLLIVALP